jgi:hypothetical protein
MKFADHSEAFYGCITFSLWYFTYFERHAGEILLLPNSWNRWNNEWSFYAVVQCEILSLTSKHCITVFLFIVRAVLLFTTEGFDYDAFIHWICNLCLMLILVLIDISSSASCCNTRQSGVYSSYYLCKLRTVASVEVIIKCLTCQFFVFAVT